MATVFHSKFGKGSVVNQENGNVTVDFNGEVKTMVVAFARLTNEDGSAFGVAFEAKEKKAKKLNKANFSSKTEKTSKYSYDSNAYWTKRELEARREETGRYNLSLEQLRRM